MKLKKNDIFKHKVNNFTFKINITPDDSDNLITGICTDKNNLKFSGFMTREFLKKEFVKIIHD